VCVCVCVCTSTHVDLLVRVCMFEFVFFVWCHYVIVCNYVKVLCV